MIFGFRTDPRKTFWQWLAGHRREFLQEIQGSGAPRGQRWSIDELGRRLKDVDGDLVHEIGMADHSTIELIISADGNRAAFPAVIELVRSAPVLQGFKITAFRPRCPHGLQLQVAGQIVTDELLTYRLVSEADALGLELFIDCELDQKTRTVVGFLGLDQRLGEYDVATGLKWIEFADGRPSDALPIMRLAQDFDSRRGIVTH